MNQSYRSSPWLVLPIPAKFGLKLRSISQLFWGHVGVLAEDASEVALGLEADSMGDRHDREFGGFDQ